MVAFTKKAIRAIDMAYTAGTEKKYRALVDVPERGKKHAHRMKNALIHEKIWTDSDIVTNNDQEKPNEKHAAKQRKNMPTHTMPTMVRNGTIRSFMARRTLPNTNDKAVQPEHELEKWRNAMRQCGCVIPKNHQTHLMHPFVPETMLHQSVPPTKNGPEKHAVTKFHVRGFSTNQKVAYLELMLMTGRTHQIRCHLAEAGMPVLDDPYYNRKYLWSLIEQIDSVDSQSIEQPNAAIEHPATNVQAADNTTGALSKTHQQVSTSDSAEPEFRKSWQSLLEKYQIEPYRRPRPEDTILLDADPSIFTEPASSSMAQQQLLALPQTGTIGWLVHALEQQSPANTRNQQRKSQLLQELRAKQVMALQAYYLSFRHPLLHNTRVTITLPPPIAWAKHTIMSPIAALDNERRTIHIEVTKDSDTTHTHTLQARE